MEKIWEEMYDAAKAVLNPRRISEYVTAGEVSAAVLSNRERYTREFASTLVQLSAYALREMPFST